MEPVIERLHRHLMQCLGSNVVGVYLFGSAVMGGLRPTSDIDMLVITERSLTRLERQALVKFLLQHSGTRATVAPGRPLEVTSIVVEDVVPWNYPAVCDFLYGEWLRDDVRAGRVPHRHVSPDLAVLVTSVLRHATCLHGPAPVDLLEPIPDDDLRRALHDSLAPLLGDLVGDEQNVLLTLARMVVTLETGQIVPKDEAADLTAQSLSDPPRSVLRLAARSYAGAVVADWTDLQQEASETADRLAERILANHR